MKRRRAVESPCIHVLTAGLLGLASVAAFFRAADGCRVASATEVALPVDVTLHTGDAPSVIVPVGLDSGAMSSLAAEPGLVFSTVVRATGAAWLRLGLDGTLLGAPEGAAFVRIRSLADGATQDLNATALRRWGDSTAYFNGDALEVQLFADDASGLVRLRAPEVIAGLPSEGGESQALCDGTDERVDSNDPRVARTMPAACTAFLIDDANHCFLSAGHCGAPSQLQVCQFNVPPSLPSGTLQHPGPEDQYPVDPVSVQALNAGIGNDWAYFGCFPNTTTGLTAYAAQGASFALAVSAPPPAGQGVRITGYGIDGGARNQVLQTDDGEYVAATNTIVRHRADTRGGNSGSAVLNLSNDTVIGIHTNGGCTTSGGSNIGCAISSPSLVEALANPQGVCAALDCNGNGASDNDDIAGGVSHDVNRNGVPDECEALPFGDLNGDFVVNGLDLSLLISAWGVGLESPSDLTGDGTVDGQDLCLLLGSWTTGQPG